MISHSVHFDGIYSNSFVSTVSEQKDK